MEAGVAFIQRTRAVLMEVGVAFMSRRRMVHNKAFQAI